MSLIRQTSVSLEHEDIVLLRSKGENVSQIVRSSIKSYLGAMDNKSTDAIGVLQKEKIDLMNIVEDLTKERDNLKIMVEKLERKANAKKILVYR